MQQDVCQQYNGIFLSRVHCLEHSDFLAQYVHPKGKSICDVLQQSICGGVGGAGHPGRRVNVTKQVAPTATPDPATSHNIIFLFFAPYICTFCFYCLFYKCYVSFFQYKILIIGHQTGYSTTTPDPATSRHVSFLPPYIWHLFGPFF